ncbi:MAG TPA: CD225/dispanin family protein [Kiritimatiellia bacterium]|jgi:hypothetical protein|nr:CD225/dispanin family protein [Kiritimatiellia bacterium]OQC58439.1 MAG: Interferon-induced transmembrane protein [Verrucomicrobia bacterium ADurb.Bin018]HOE00735.1 CD225/dispanin family protein [Kiritimatiellia bacterium]HOE36900.1 CD225/dispanin family protein [Kiritimatiellia bacterium]HOR75168.1 CD225/dispanin family protein [Kiritimatiellia bacterium]
MGDTPNLNPQNIPNYLWQSIVVTVLCCLPLGIPAIIYASKVNNALMQGNQQAAWQASNTAKMWCIIALVAGLMGGFLYFMVFGLALIFG